MAAVARRQFCAKLHVITPQQVQWKPPLRQAAGTLCDTRRKIVRKRTEIQWKKVNTKERLIEQYIKKQALIQKNKLWYRKEED